MRLTRLAAALAVAVGLAAPAAAKDNPWRSVVEAREAAVMKRLGLERPPRGSSPRVIGGTVAPAGAWPFTVGLLSTGIASNYDAQFCAGSLIARRLVLTAAHCVEGTLAADTQVLVGTQNLAKGGRRVSVAAFMIHPKFDPVTFDYDVAVLLLAEPHGINAAVVLPSAGSAAALAAPGRLSTVMGWGDTDPTFGIDYPERMHQTSIRIVSQNVCNGPTSYDGLITARMICAGPLAGGRDACQGDSGGPLVVRDGNGKWRVQVGITSWGFACAIADFPGVYTRVSAVRTWIVGATAKLVADAGGTLHRRPRP